MKIASNSMGRRRTAKISLPNCVGSSLELQTHSYGPEDSTESIYIQASLHADELPGIMVIHHLMKELDELESHGLIHKKITLVPFANPLGLAQELLGNHVGRFSLSSGTNFNRNFGDYTAKIDARIKGGSLELSDDDALKNVECIREALREEIEKTLVSNHLSTENRLKYNLLKLASGADIVIDLHCDSNALLHMYTHTQLWPEMRDLAGDLGTYCTLLADAGEGTCFDEVCSNVWQNLADKYPQKAIPMACKSVTVELRGKADLSDEIGIQDAGALKTFLHRRGFLSMPEGQAPLPVKAPRREATLLTAVDFLDAGATGLLIMKKKLGDMVKKGDLIAEIVSIDDPDSPRTPVIARNEGVIFCTALPSKGLMGPGRGVVAKICGEEELEWRQGNLLTSK